MCDKLELYALNSLSSEEMVAFETHLAACDTCPKELASYHETLALLALDLDPVKPPARLKMSVLSLTAKTEQDGPELPLNVTPIRARGFSRRPVALLLSSAAAIAFFALGSVWGLNHVEAPTSPTSPAITQTQQASAVWDEVAAAPDSTSMEKRSSGGGSVQVVYSPSMDRAVMATKDLPLLSEEQVYQLWFQRDGVMVPAGTVSQSGDFMVAPPAGVSGASGLGLTIEPAPGSESPTTAPLVFLKL